MWWASAWERAHVPKRAHTHTPTHPQSVDKNRSRPFGKRAFADSDSTHTHTLWRYYKFVCVSRGTQTHPNRKHTQKIWSEQIRFPLSRARFVCILGWVAGQRFVVTPPPQTQHQTYARCYAAVLGKIEFTRARFFQCSTECEPHMFAYILFCISYYCFVSPCCTRSDLCLRAEFAWCRPSQILAYSTF